MSSVSVDGHPGQTDPSTGTKSGGRIARRDSALGRYIRVLTRKSLARPLAAFGAALTELSEALAGGDYKLAQQAGPDPGVQPFGDAIAAYIPVGLNQGVWRPDDEGRWQRGAQHGLIGGDPSWTPSPLTIAEIEGLIGGAP